MMAIDIRKKRRYCWLIAVIHSVLVEVVLRGIHKEAWSILNTASSFQTDVYVGTTLQKGIHITESLSVKEVEI